MVEKYECICGNKKDEMFSYIYDMADGEVWQCLDCGDKLIIEFEEEVQQKNQKNEHGGKREGAGRKKSAPTVVYQLNINKQLRDDLRAKYTVKEINAKIRELLVSLNCV